MVFLISTEDIKNYMSINGNVDDEMFNQAILYVQAINIKPLLGTGLFDEMLSQVESASLSNDNQILLEEYIHPAMRYWIMSEMVRPLAFQFTNVGIMQNNTTFSQPVSSNDLEKLEVHYKNRAEVLAQRAVSFICANSDLYPLYSNPGTSGDTIAPKKQQFTNNFYGTKNKINRH